MSDKIMIRLKSELRRLPRILEKRYHLKTLSPLAYHAIVDFSKRPSKLIRPILFLNSYKNFKTRIPTCAYISAIGLEMIHNFMLIHDDIIDGADRRRWRPAIHAILGRDQAIIVGDILFAVGLDLFTQIHAKEQIKQNALTYLLKTAVMTGCGQSKELLMQNRSLRSIKPEEILENYELKTARYSFAAPMVLGAMLAGADPNQIKAIERRGIKDGIAFQLKDDLADIENSFTKNGKSSGDIPSKKRTYTLIRAYHKAPAKDKRFLEDKLESTKRLTQKDTEKIRKLIRNP